MKDNIDDSLNELLGSRRNIYTNEEITAAKKRQKKEGGTLLDNLIAVTGRSMPSMSDVIQNSNDIRRMCEQAGIALDETIAQNQAQLSKQITEMSKNL